MKLRVGLAIPIGFNIYGYNMGNVDLRGYRISGLDSFKKSTFPQVQIIEFHNLTLTKKN